ncbi:MAG: DEAD/DEAH box helicase [Candidatus Nanopelagicales bacterium]
MSNFHRKLNSFKGVSHSDFEILSEFKMGLPFELDNFQIEAIEYFLQGSSVVVAAPTGSGKTIVGEFAVFYVNKKNQRTFYTTPLKALSNQKYLELVERFGVENVGLLTGDNAINQDAAIVVMTTEVLRNMIYQTPEKIEELGVAILDEVHFLADKERGVVWEEILILLNKNVKIVALSATVSNVEDFADWLHEIRGDCKFVIEEKRPVPLSQLIATSNSLIPLFSNEEGQINKKVINLYKRSFTKSHVKIEIPTRVEIVENIKDYDLLPSIFFIFSRKGCDIAVDQIRKSNVQLTNEQERFEIKKYLQNRFDDIDASDWSALRVDEWIDCAVRGFSSHHAGLIPQMKEAAEYLFQRGLLKLIFATETLSVGINMPAKSVVLERMDKWNGTNHEMLSPAEFTQLTGRAGRRGIDVDGEAIIAFHPHTEPKFIANLVSSRTFELTSTFEPKYNMVLNLLEHRDLNETKKLLNKSFAQYYQKIDSKNVIEQINYESEKLKRKQIEFTCHLGDIKDYYSIILQINQYHKKENNNSRRSKSLGSTNDLMPGNIIGIKNLRKSKFALITKSLKTRKSREFWAVLDNGEGRKIDARNVDLNIGVIGFLDLDERLDFSKKILRDDYAKKIRSISRSNENRQGSVLDLNEIKSRLKNHICHQCPQIQEHLRFGENIERNKKYIKSLEAHLENDFVNLSKKCDRVIDVLQKLGYIETNESTILLTQSGRLLKQIHSEFDLLIVESLRRALFDGLNPIQLSCLLSGFVYNPRRDEIDTPLNVDEIIKNNANLILKLSDEIIEIERKLKISNIRSPHFGMANVIKQWCSGVNLKKILVKTDIAPGDFVRNVKQIIDLLRQIKRLNIDDVSKTAEEAILLLDKGVVSYEPNVN